MSIEAIVPKALKPVRAQREFMRSKKRFNCGFAGRRSGKTMTGKCRGFRRAFNIPYSDGRIIFAGPTHGQAKKIFWKPLKKAFKPFILGRPLESELSFQLCNGVTVEVMGLDKPERAEGAPLDHIQIDEYANCRPEAWTENIRPMLAERNGTADFTGTPEGRNHAYDLWTEALADDEWGAFTWTSEEVLPPAEIERLKRDLDPLTYQQEVLASFVNFEGRAYYAFDINTHVRPCEYDADQPIAVCMDFNAKPGNCSVIQEHPVYGTQVLFEVFINRYSNTIEVCQALLAQIKDHRGDVRLYGDPAGNQKKSSGVMGTDWDLVRQVLQPVFGARLKWRVPRGAPNVRDSINATNGRISSGAFRVSPSCTWVIRDLEGTERDETGDIVKKQGDLLTHLTDGIRYYMAAAHPVVGVIGNTTAIM